MTDNQRFPALSCNTPANKVTQLDRLLGAVFKDQKEHDALCKVLRLPSGANVYELHQKAVLLGRELRVLSSTHAMADELKNLRQNAMTPSMEAIINRVHDAAGNGEPGQDITITVPEVVYLALCEEEDARANSTGIFAAFNSHN